MVFLAEFSDTLVSADWMALIYCKNHFTSVARHRFVAFFAVKERRHVCCPEIETAKSITYFDLEAI
jgi:hypothetical protein